MRRTAIALVAIIATSSAALAGGVRFTAGLWTDKGMVGGSEHQKLTVTLSGVRGKIEFVESDAPGIAVGDYLLTGDGGQTATLVQPAEKTQSPCHVDPIFGTIRGAKDTKSLESILEDVKVELLEENEGEAVAGYPTTHYRFRISYTSTITRRRGVSTVSRALDQEVWCTPAVAPEQLALWPVQIPPRLGDEGLNEAVVSGMARLNGFPLKVITTLKSIESDGREGTREARFEVVELVQHEAPDSEFHVPEGLSVTEFRAPNRGGGGTFVNPLVPVP